MKEDKDKKIYTKEELFSMLDGQRETPSNLDDFEKDALEGLSLVKDRSRMNAIPAELDQHLKAALKKEKKKSRMFLYAAASIALIAVISFLMVQEFNPSKFSHLAVVRENKEKKTEEASPPEVHSQNFLPSEKEAPISHESTKIAHDQLPVSESNGVERLTVKSKEPSEPEQQDRKGGGNNAHLSDYNASVPAENTFSRSAQTKAETGGKVVAADHNETPAQNAKPGNEAEAMTGKDLATNDAVDSPSNSSQNEKNSMPALNEEKVSQNREEEKVESDKKVGKSPNATKKSNVSPKGDSGSEQGNLSQGAAVLSKNAPEAGKIETSALTLLKFEGRANFPGGKPALQQFLSAYLIPAGQEQKDTLRFSFSVLRSGAVNASSIKILYESLGCKKCLDKIKTALKNSPLWIPAVEGGKNVVSLVVMEVYF